METQKQITLSPKAEREIVLAQLNEKSVMLIGFSDIASLIGNEASYVQKIISKLPGFPKPVELQEDSRKKVFVSGDVIRWIKRNAPRFH